MGNEEKPIIFFNVGWMKAYRGQNNTDKIQGGGSWVAEHGMGGEITNFLPYNGMVYGYVQPPGEEINLERLGVQNQDSVDGVDVVWTANDPSGGTFIVGWYRNAQVFRHFQKFPESWPQTKFGCPGYYAQAKENDCTLLSVDCRTFEIPRQQKGFLGQANVWYAASSNIADWLATAKEYISNGGQAVPSQSNPARCPIQPDTSRRLRIEQSAIKTVWTYYDKLGYEVSSVENDRCGWDLEAVRGSRKLLLEVKGLASGEIAVELTPNEYYHFIERRDEYRLCVVTKALDNEPALTIFTFNSENEKWESDDSRRLELCILERKGARMSV